MLSRGGLPGDCAAAIDNDPVKAAQIFDQAPATSSAMKKVKKLDLEVALIKEIEQKQKFMRGKDEQGKSRIQK